jgi:hypothetical protein
VLATSMRDQFLDAPRSFRSFALLPNKRNEIPRVERVWPLDASFEPLIGDHPGHAGEGLGPRALQRPV